MRKWQHTTIAVMAAGILIFSSTQCFAAAKDEYQNAFIEFLEIGPATELNLIGHGKSPADINKSLTEIYHSNGLQPFWIENGKPSQRAADIISVLADAESQGLDPFSYFVDLINYYKDSKDTADLVRLDILLSLGMMRFVADQREGRKAPREIDPVLFDSARDVELDLVSLRQAAFEAPDMKAFLAQQAPPFLQYRKLQKKLTEYRVIASSGGWSSIAAGETLKPGMEDSRIKEVRQRLAATGELATENMDSALFDPALEEAVKLFQKRHNLHPDGAIGKQTLSAMNIPVAARIEQINVNMERYRWLKRDMKGSLVAVNIAGFEAMAGVPGKFDLSMPVVVGKLHHETPVFSDTIKHVVFNPFWTLTPNIARNETLPKLKKDPLYLQKHNMRIFQGWGADSKELDSTKIDWSKVSKKDMNKYRIRQDPGPKNALGTLKLIFPNKYDVYLHDTPSHALFKKEKRAFSHGCIRMARPVEMASWVLGGDEKGWGIERIKKIIKARERHVVVLEKPVPIHILYRTAFVDPESNMLHFYEDVYGRDKLLAQALFGSGS
ncbi:MAG: L,D-transpeptidase family protein [Pseudomonadota bacterium]|nr:L,D-transpeptidase family protein [Pseudomonadota bacterium]